MPPGPFPPRRLAATLSQVLHGVAVAKVQDPALGLVELHPIDLSLAIQLVQIPL